MTHRPPQTILACAAPAVTRSFPLSASARPAGVDAKADKLLRAMTTYMAGLPKFSVKTENSLEAVTTEGRRIPSVAPAALSFQRPDKLVAQRRGDVADQRLQQRAEPRFVAAEQPGPRGANAVSSNGARRLRHESSAAAARIGTAALPGRVEQAYRSCSAAFAVSRAPHQAVARVGARLRTQFW